MASRFTEEDLRQNYKYRFKYILVGDDEVGKTCLVHKFDKNEFIGSYWPTIGMDFSIKSIVLDEKIIKIQLWETAGAERYRAIMPAFYQGAAGIIVVYDVTNRLSFDNLVRWRMKEIKEKNTSDAIVCLVGNKCDIKNERKVTYSEGKELADKWGALIIETSAKDGVNVEQMFVLLTSKIVQKLENDSEENAKDKTKKIRLHNSTTGIFRNCCRMICDTIMR